MARRVQQATLNASTLDILNVIRENASYDYQQNVPKVTKESDIPKVGEVIYGTPAFANQFINALVNRIAMVRMNSATFNNPYSHLKKGYLEFGETIEEIFVGLAKAVDFNVDKAGAREFKRTLPDVRTAFHVLNYRVMYPITVQREELRMAFLNASGVTSLIEKIVQSVYTAAEYDEFLLFKYMMIKAVNSNCYKTISVTGNTTADAIAFRGVSNKLPFMSDKYNEAGVKNTTPRDKQIIFMDADYNAQFDVEVLAGAFNMEKTDFIGQLHLIDEWDSFDNERFDIIRANSDGLEEVTAEELSKMSNVKAIIMDADWFQVYDNLNLMTDKEVASGLYWNYFYHVWKTISYSPFANAIALVDSESTVPNSITVKVASKDVSDIATVFTFESGAGVMFEQTEALTTNGIGVQKYGALLIPVSKIAQNITLVATLNGFTYTATTNVTGATEVGTSITLNKNA